MNRFILRSLPLAMLLAAPGIAASQDNGDDDEDELGVTMSVMEDQGGAGEEGFFNEIELPDIAPEEAHSSAEGGIDTANEARDNEARDNEARDQARDVGGEQAEESRDRGDTGRGIGDEARGNADSRRP